MLLQVTHCILLTLAMSLAQETCRYEFTVPKTQEGCLHSSKSIEDRILQLERAVTNMTKKSEATDVSNSAIHDIAGLVKTVASVKFQQDALNDKIVNLTSSAVKEDDMETVIQELTAVMDNMTAKSDIRLDQMTASVQQFFHSLTSLESSVNVQIRENHDRLALYLQELLDVKKQVADAEVNTNSSRMKTLVQDLEDFKKTLYTSLGVNKARYEEVVKKDNDVEAVLKNHTEAINHLMLHSQAMVEHTHVMTDNIRTISSEVEVLNNYARLKIAELEGKTMMMTNDEPMPADEPMVKDVVLNSLVNNDANVKNITAKIQTSLERLGEHLVEMMPTEADEDVNKPDRHREDVDEGKRVGLDFSSGPSVPQLQDVDEGRGGKRTEEPGAGPSQDAKLHDMRREVKRVQDLYQQLVQAYLSSDRCRV